MLHDLLGRVCTCHHLFSLNVRIVFESVLFSLLVVVERYLVDLLTQVVYRVRRALPLVMMMYEVCRSYGRVLEAGDTAGCT